MADEKTVRCASCASEFTDKEIEGARACPKCGTESVPCAIADDVTLKINWHELRILTIWADNWAESSCPAHSRKTLAAIIGRLHDQFPDKTPLTLGGEVRKLQDSGISAELMKGDGTVLVPRRDKN